MRQWRLPGYPAFSSLLREFTMPGFQPEGDLPFSGPNGPNDRENGLNSVSADPNQNLPARILSKRKEAYLIAGEESEWWLRDKSACV